MTKTTPVKDIMAGATSGLIETTKRHPTGATTNSDSGVRDMLSLKEMAKVRLTILLHGGVTNTLSVFLTAKGTGEIEVFGPGFPVYWRCEDASSF